jgi:hypothetical protein
VAITIKTYCKPLIKLLLLASLDAYPKQTNAIEIIQIQGLVLRYVDPYSWIFVILVAISKDAHQGK